MPNLDTFKQGFFDRDKVQRAVDRGVRKVLSRFGAFTRKRARTSIRKRKKISEPGKPPSSHVGTLRNAILFAYDTKAKAVVIGPHQAGKSGAGAQALEYGGRVSVRNLRKKRPLNYRARPFMNPAFQAELPGVVGQLRGMIRP